MREELEKYWKGFNFGNWCGEVDVRDFIQKNYKPYTGDSSFLCGATERTKKLWDKVMVLMKEESEKGILDAETKIPAGITAYGSG